MRQNKFAPSISTKKLIEGATYEIPGLKLKLRQFQKEGVKFIDQKNGRALICDEMGLGKSAQTIAWLQKHENKRPAIIVVPSSLKYNWKEEIKKWVFPKIQILQGTTPYEIFGKLIIINYDVLQFWVDDLLKINPQVLILDEVHAIKNRKSIRTKAVQFLAKNISNIIALTGTPIPNRHMEIYNIWKIIDPVNCPPFHSFGNVYCGGKAFFFSKSTNRQELHNRLTSTCMLRRLKKDVLPELPEKQKTIIPFEIDNRKEYDFAENNFIKFIKESKGNIAAKKASNAIAFTQISILKQLAAKGKLKYCIEWIENFLETENKLIVFCTSTFILNSIYSYFKKVSVKVDGSVPDKLRQEFVNSFQTNPNINLFIGMLDSQGKPAGVGLNLTASKATVTVELQWSPKVHEQAEDRIHRLTQKFSVNNYYLIAMNTIEEKILNILDYKTKIIDSTIDNIEPDMNSLLGELLRQYKNDN